MINEQRKQGIDAHALVHGDPEPGDPPWIQRVPVQFSLVYAPIALGFRSAFRDAIEQIRPEIIHLHLPNNSALWALTLPSARKTPWVIHWHSDVVVSNIKWSVALAYLLYRPFEQALLEKAAKVFATSPPYLNASAALQSWKGKTSIIPLGINLDAIAEPSAPCTHLTWRQPRSLKLLSIGRLTYYKGFETLIEAVLGMRDVELLIVGEGELRPQLEAMLKSQPDGLERVRLLGSLEEPEKHTLLAQCEVFCLASRERTEAFGIVLLEAMLHGKPSIVTDLPGSGMPWVISQSKAGLHVPFEDIDAWRAAIARLHHDPKLRKALGANGSTALHQYFEIAPCARLISKHYRAIAPDSTRTPKPKGLQIIISARNQASQIGNLIGKIKILQPNAAIALVDNRSTDGTGQVAQEYGVTVIRPLLAMTSWGSVQTGLRYAKANGYRAAVTIDANGNYDIEAINELILEGEKTDLSIAYFGTKQSWIRKIAWSWYSLLTGFSVKEYASGYRYYNEKALSVAISAEATLLDYQDVGTLLLMRSRGINIKEVSLKLKNSRNEDENIFKSWYQAIRYGLVSTLVCIAYRKMKLRRLPMD